MSHDAGEKPVAYLENAGWQKTLMELISDADLQPHRALTLLCTVPPQGGQSLGEQAAQKQAQDQRGQSGDKQRPEDGQLGVAL